MFHDIRLYTVCWPRTKTRTGADVWPAPIGEYGVQEYWPSSEDITGCRMSVPYLLTLACWTVWKSSIRPSFDQTTTVRGGLDCTGQSMRPIRPRGKYTRSGMFNTRGRSVYRQLTLSAGDNCRSDRLKVLLDLAKFNVIAVNLGGNF